MDAHVELIYSKCIPPKPMYHFFSILPLQVSAVFTLFCRKSYPYLRNSYLIAQLLYLITKRSSEVNAEIFQIYFCLPSLFSSQNYTCQDRDTGQGQGQLKHVYKAQQSAVVFARYKTVNLFSNWENCCLVYK